MTTSVSKTTPQTAPRDAQGLMKIGIFQLRVLIDDCGGLKTPEEKMAFAKMSVEEKVQLAQQLLAKWDAQNGGHQMNGAGHAMQAPPPMQMMPPPPGMQQVDPAAVAAAAQAAAPPPTTRQPRNSSKAAAAAAGPTDLGADVINLLNRIVEQNDEMAAAQAASSKEMLSQIAEANKTNGENTSNYKAVYGALTQMNAQLQSIQYQSKLAMALSLQLAEQVLGGATRDQVLGAAMGDVDVIGQIITQASNPGKG